MRHLLVAALLPIAAIAQTPCRTPLGVPCHTIRFQLTQWNLFGAGITDVQRLRIEKLSALRRDGSSLTIDNHEVFTLTGGRHIGATLVNIYLTTTGQSVAINHDQKLISIWEPDYRPARRSVDGDTTCSTGIRQYGGHFQQSGQDTVAGIPVLKWASGDDQIYLAPGLDCAALKVGRVTRNSWHVPVHFESVEALSVEFGEPRPELFMIPKGYRSVDYQAVFLSR